MLGLYLFVCLLYNEHLETYHPTQKKSLKLAYQLLKLLISSFSIAFPCFHHSHLPSGIHYPEFGIYHTLKHNNLNTYYLVSIIFELLKKGIMLFEVVDTGRPEQTVSHCYNLPQVGHVV